MGRHAYQAGQPSSANPFKSESYDYTDEGLRRLAWLNGYRFEWILEKCPAERWPEAGNTYLAIKTRGETP